MNTQSKQLRTFSSDRLDQQDPKWVEATTEVPAEEAEEAPAEAAEDETPVPAFRPPAIVVESRIPNVMLDELTASKLPTDFCTVVVVQGEDPKDVADKIAVLKKQLFQEEQDGEK